jgi:hypothetical protein
VEDALRDEYREVAAQWTAEDAEAMAVARNCQDSRRQSDRALALSRDNFTVERISRALALCGAEEEALALTRELAGRFSTATLTMKLQVPVTNAIVAARRGDAARVVQLLEDVSAYDHAPAAEFWPPYLRGQAYLALTQARDAAAQFARIIDHRGEAPTSPLYALTLAGSARASALAGDVHAARTQYARLFDGWSTADAELDVLKEARRDYERIR